MSLVSTSNISVLDMLPSCELATAFFAASKASFSSSESLVEILESLLGLYSPPLAA